MTVNADIAQRAAASAASEVDLRAEILDGYSGLRQIEQGWRSLAADATDASCFYTPSYFRAWRDVLSADLHAALIATFRGRSLCGIMPIMHARVRRGPLGAPRHDFAPLDRAFLRNSRPRPLSLRQISPVVSIPATLVGPVPLCRPADLDLIVRVMAERLAEFEDWDVLALPVYEGPHQAAWIDGLRSVGLAPWLHRLDRHIHGIRTLEPFDTIVARQSRNFRKNIRRARAAAQQAGIVFEIHEGREAVTLNFETIAAVARASWKQTAERDGLTVPYDGPQRDFFQALLANPASDADISPVLAVARCRDEAIAVLLSLRLRNKLTAIITFRNDREPKASPGLLLLGRMIDWAVDQGITAYDLNVSQDWARPLVDEVRPQNVVICFAKTLRGRMFGLISAAARQLR